MDRTVRRWGRVALTLALVAGAVAPARAAEASCARSAADRAAIEGMLAAWQTASRDALRVKGRPLPWIVFFDASCVWHVNPEGEASAALAEGRPVAEAKVTVDRRPVLVRGFRHEGKVRLPSGDEVPPQLTTFAATYGEGKLPFFVMAMPSIWRAEARHRDDPNLEALMRSVFVHEMTHTLQAPTLGRRVDALVERHGLGDDLNDDVVQTRFAERPGFREAYERERELLFRAASAPDAQSRRALAAEALEAMKTRRARYFTGDDAVYAELEDLFLNMEGVAQWAAYQSARRERLGEVNVLAFIRRGGRFWSQDEGLAIFLVVDALVPGWQARTLGPTPASVIELLAEAARGRT